jgi:hypothetical protein
VGRSETPVDPTQGPLEHLAHDLQVLRRKAGEPPYRTMARHVGASHAALSEAAKGRRLPSLHIVLAYVRACGGDTCAERHWHDRWEYVRDALARSAQTDAPAPVHADPRPPTPPPEDGEDTGAAPPSAPTVAPQSRWRLAVAALLGCLVTASAAAGLDAVGVGVSHAGDQKPSDLPVRYPYDGEDPYVAGCGRDQQPLERQPIYRSDGVFYGWLILFYSASCSANWGYVVGPNSAQWTVSITAHRMDDGARTTSSYRGDARPDSWGNLLSARSGCVRVEAWIDTGPRAVTSCWRPNGPVSYAQTP